MKRAILLGAAVVTAGVAAAVVAIPLLGAEKKLGTGYQLENVEILDPAMGLPDAREYMMTFNDALGVECRDCHDLRNFAGDGKELKLAARAMMRMTAEINERWYAGTGAEGVTCFTCHQGRRVPLKGPGEEVREVTGRPPNRPSGSPAEPE